MSGAATPNTKRLVTTVTILFAIGIVAAVVLADAPRMELLRSRLDAARERLASDAVAASGMAALRARRQALSTRERDAAARNPEATFLASLGAITQRHGVALVSVTETRDASSQPALASAPPAIAFTLEVRGSYGNVLGAIADLSRGPEVVRVEPPTLRRDGHAVDASVPVTIFPAQRGDRP